MSSRHDGNHDAQDLALLDQIAGHGLDLMRPLLVDHFFVFPGAVSAHKAARRLRRGIDGTVAARVQKLPRGYEGWSVEIQHSTVLDRERVRGLRRDMTALAEGLGGKYDGWGTELP